MGILVNKKELPKTKALGLELRLDCVIGAPVSILDGEFSDERFRADFELCEDAKKNQDSICKAMKFAIKHFKWTGVVGCSVKSQVADRLGDAILTSIERRLKSSVTLFQAVSASDAVGYFELVWGETADQAKWRGQVLLVFTLSAEIEVALYNNGRRIRHFPLSKDSVQQWQSLVLSAFPSASPDEPSPPPPSTGDERWARWSGLADQHISDTLLQFERGCGKLDRLVVVPTGRLTKIEHTDICRCLGRTVEAAAAMGCDFVLTSSPMTAGARGAAVAAVLALQEQQLMRTLQPMLSAGSSLQDLSGAQIRSIFQVLDTSGDGHLDIQELIAAMERVGVQKGAEELMKELDTDESGSVDIEEFIEWWERNIRKANVVTVTSAEACERILAEAPEGCPHGLKLLMVTFTFCRTCRAFEPKFHRAAKSYPNIRFCELVGNGTVGAMDFCTKELAVKQSPAFFLFGKDGQRLAQWTGGKMEQLEENLAPYAAEQQALA